MLVKVATFPIRVPHSVLFWNRLEKANFSSVDDFLKTYLANYIVHSLDPRFDVFGWEAGESERLAVICRLERNEYSFDLDKRLDEFQLKPATLEDLVALATDFRRELEEYLPLTVTAVFYPILLKDFSLKRSYGSVHEEAIDPLTKAAGTHIVGIQEGPD